MNTNSPMNTSILVMTALQSPIVQTKGVYIIGDMHLAGFANIDKRVRYKVCTCMM